MPGEFAFIDRLRARFPLVGDDCAVVDGLLLAADAVVEGIHVDLTRLSLADVGWKAVVANVSDIAAMGGVPRWLLVTVSTSSMEGLDDLVDGLADAAAEYGCELVGGDLTRTDGPLVVSVSIIGEVTSGPAAVRRTGARPGDTIYVTGPLGAAAAAGWTARPRAQVADGLAARMGGATAMIDVSDGFAADLGHILDDSGVGCALDGVPVAEGATLEQALHGGEDYELVVCGPPGLPFIAVGMCTADPGRRTLGAEPLPPGGWEHRWE